MTAKVIVLNSDFEVEVRILKRDTTTGLLNPASGLVGVTYTFSATEGGSAIDPSLILTLSERVGAPGVYWAILSGGIITSYLLPYVDRRIYGVCNYLTALNTSTPVVVRATIQP